ncbi:hypothetical protein Lal_00009405 [Lupinus albus]|nr:hypothetical protein Lal_00009405 [Lupinus albus]
MAPTKMVLFAATTSILKLRYIQYHGTLGFEEGSLLETLSVALAGIGRSNLCLRTPLVICGAGPIGLVTLLEARAAGAAPIVITDLDENSLAKASSLVSRVITVLVERGVDAGNLGKRIVDTLGQEARLALKCTGVESSIHSVIHVSTSGITIANASPQLTHASRLQRLAVPYSLLASSKTSRISPLCIFPRKRSISASTIVIMILTIRQLALWPKD